MTLEAFERFGEKPGYVYELIDGVLNVSPTPKIPHGIWKEFVTDQLKAYARDHRDVIRYVTTDCEIVIPGRPGPTRPRPDVAAFKDFPSLDYAADHPEWDDVCPLLVVEVISPRRRRKDVARNRHLYWAAKGIVEYWIVDPAKDFRQPSLVALRREVRRVDWVERKVMFGQKYETPTLPGLVLNLADVTS